jgi:hypothetical protein
MLQRLTVDIINSNALNLLKDLEALKLIKLSTLNKKKTSQKSLLSLKGSVKKQSLKKTELQLKNLREEWG